MRADGNSIKQQLVNMPRSACITELVLAGCYTRDKSPEEVQRLSMNPVHELDNAFLWVLSHSAIDPTLLQLSRVERVTFAVSGL